MQKAGEGRINNKKEDDGMKKLFTLLLAIAMLLSLCACASSGVPENNGDILDEEWEDSDDAKEDLNEDTAEITESGEKIYKIGETLVSADGMVEFTIDDITFCKYLDLDAWKPGVEGGAKTNTAPDGKTYLFYTGTLKFVGETKDIWEYCITAELDYNNGQKFKYTSSSFFEVGDDSSSDYMAVFDPLTGTNVREVRGYIREVDEAVESDTQAPLLLNLRWYSACEATEYREEHQFTVRLR